MWELDFKSFQQLLREIGGFRIWGRTWTIDQLVYMKQHSMHMLAFPKDINGKGATGTLTKIDGVETGGNNVLVYFRSKDCSIEEGRIEKAGGKVFRNKVSVGEFGYICLAYDTEGNMFGILSQK